jgi:thioredoxin-dependent peroxiredoxin
MALKEGDKAPSFSLLDEYKGKTRVVYFYPKDDTPGCTVEACAFRDNIRKIEGLDAVVIGVSPDDEASHDKFIGKFKLPFRLFPDTDKKVSEAYGVWVKKSMYGKEYMGVARTTFIVGKDGKIKKIYEKVKPEGHAEEVLGALKDA